MLLSSVERLIRFLCVEDTATNRRVLNQYLYGISAQIESYLNTKFSLVSRTEYFDVRPNELEYWVQGVPITTITSVSHDIDGQFDGSESTLSDSHTGKLDKSVVLDYEVTPGKKALKIVYTGGYASTPTKSTFAISSIQGTFLADKYVTGATSGAVGIITATTAATPIIVDVLYGAFEVGESLTMQTTEGGADTSGVSAIIDSKTVESLAEVVPEVPLACEMQIRYNVTTKGDFEVSKIEKDKTTRRDMDKLFFSGKFVDLQPEVRSMLSRFKRITL